MALSHSGFGVEDHLTVDEEWYSEQLWALLVAKATGPAFTMIVGLDNVPRSRGVRAWHKLMREAKETHTVQVHEVTERLHATERWLRAASTPPSGCEPPHGATGEGDASDAMLMLG